MKKNLIFGLFAILLAACGTVPNPIPGQFSNNFSLGEVAAEFDLDSSLPERYDASVKDFLDNRMPAGEKAEFLRFLGSAGVVDVTLSESYLRWLIINKTRNGLASGLKGARGADVSINIVDAAVPNAASLLLVGEVLSVSVIFEVKESDLGNTLIKSKRIFLDAMSGKGDGLRGALGRSGRDQHVRDLNLLAEAVASTVVRYMTQSEVDYGFDKQIEQIDRAAIARDAATP